jgi:hypothetical protein
MTHDATRECNPLNQNTVYANPSSRQRKQKGIQLPISNHANAVVSVITSRQTISSHLSPPSSREPGLHTYADRRRHNDFRCWQAFPRRRAPNDCALPILLSLSGDGLGKHNLLWRSQTAFALLCGSFHAYRDNVECWQLCV